MNSIAPAKRRAASAAALQTILSSRRAKADLGARRAVRVDALRENQPGFGAHIDVSCDDVLAHKDFSREHWPEVAAPPPFERVSHAVPRRAGVVRHFPGDGVILRVGGAPMLSGDAARAGAPKPA